MKKQKPYWIVLKMWKKLSNHLKMDILFTLAIVFGAILPSAVMVSKYEIIQHFMAQPTKIQLPIIGISIILIVFIIYFKKIIKHINSLPFTMFRCIINGIVKAIPLVALFFLLGNMRTIMERLLDDIQFVFNWYFWCNMIVLFIFEPAYRYYKNEYLADVEYQKYRKREILSKGE